MCLAGLVCIQCKSCLVVHHKEHWYLGNQWNSSCPRWSPLSTSTHHFRIHCKVTMVLVQMKTYKSVTLPNFRLRPISFKVFAASRVFHSLVHTGTVSYRDAVTVFVQGLATRTVASLDTDGSARTVKINIVTRSGARVSALLIRLTKGTFDSCNIAK
jgi:hypothetical protein